MKRFMNDKFLHWLAVSLVALALALLANSASAADQITWQSIPPAEQAVLQDFADKWPEFAAEKQQQLLTGAQRWSKMTHQERVRVREQLKEWKASALIR